MTDKKKKRKSHHETAKAKGLMPMQCYDTPEIYDGMQARAIEENASMADMMRRAFRIFLYGPTGRKPDHK